MKKQHLSGEMSSFSRGRSSKCKVLSTVFFLVLIMALVYHKHLKIYRNIAVESRLEKPQRNREQSFDEISAKQATFVGSKRITAQVICESTHLGCYNVQSQTPRFTQHHSNMSRVWCLSTCQSRNFPFAAIEDGEICKCFTTLKRVEDFLNPQSECTISCKGNKQEVCGGKTVANLYFIRGKCLKEPLSSADVMKRSRGCLRLPFDSGDSQDATSVTSPVDCFRMCEQEHHPMAIYRKARGCWCGRLKISLDLNKRTVDCKAPETTAELFRTAVEDERCGNVRLLPPGDYTRTLLATYPGSGNTWTRYLLEKATGFYTGSGYADTSLLNTGYLGENIPVAKKRTDIIKDHIIWKQYNSFQHTNATIVIIRNPYRAFISYLNFEKSVGDRHVAHASTEILKREFNTQLVEKRVKDWLAVAEYAINSGKSYLIVYYEDIVADPISAVRKMVEFLPNRLLHPSNLEERLACLSQDTTGLAKRSRPAVLVNPYGAEARKRINEGIATMREMLRKAGLKGELPPYEKDPDYAV